MSKTLKEIKLISHFILQFKMNFLITHGPCLDGETCALFLKQWADEQKETLQTVFCFAGQLSIDLIKRKMPENTCRIFICDLTVNQETLEYLNSLNKEIWIIDHHQKLSNVPEKITYLHRDRCAAWIVWEKFRSDSKSVTPILQGVKPQLLEYIDEQDRGLHHLPYLKEIIAGVHFEKKRIGLERVFQEFSVDRYIQIGTILNEHRQRQIEEMIKFGYKRQMKWQGKDYQILFISGDRTLRSEGLEESKADITMFYTYDAATNEFWVACRSQELDLLPIISNITWCSGNEFRKGGGHPKACGFTVNQATTFEFITMMEGSVSSASYHQPSQIGYKIELQGLVPQKFCFPIFFHSWINDLLKAIEKFDQVISEGTSRVDEIY